MKVDIIKQSIINRFETISKKSKVKPEKENIVPAWGLIYKNNGTKGFVSEFGTVERNGSKIDIVDGEVKQVKKPFYRTWKQTLRNFDNMLANIEENLDNKDIIEKKTVSFVCFPKDLADRIDAINRNIHKS